MTDERKEQRKFEKAMRSQGFNNERLRRPVNTSIYFDSAVSFAWTIWKLARANQIDFTKPYRKAFICSACEGVYADQPVSQCDCMANAEFIEARIVIL